MASEDSKYRDGRRRLIDVAIVAIRSIPSTDRCTERRINATTSAKDTKSVCFAVKSGFASKNGMMRSDRSLSRRTQKRHTSSR